MKNSSLAKSLRKAEDGAPIFQYPQLKDAVHWTPSENIPIHRWFRYREGFSPSLLNQFSNSKHRLDPFCGCGTTLLESSIRGAHSYGVDVNPLATFITRTKTQRYSAGDRKLFIALSNEIFHEYRQATPDVPEYALLTKLYLPESLSVLLKLKARISSVKPLKIRNLLFLVWLSLLEESSNAFKEGNGLKYRNKKRRPGTYVTVPDSEWIPKHFGNDISAFIENLWKEKCAAVAEDLALHAMPNGFTPVVRTGSCLEKRNLDFDQPVDLAIFSPPYANRFDYFEAFKVELWMGGFVSSSEDMADLRRDSMQSNLTVRKTSSESDWPELAPFLNCMEESASSVRMGIKNTLQGYFHDTRTLLKSLKPVVTKKAKVVVVVGNSAYANSIIPTDVLVAKIGAEEGYRVKAIQVARNLHVSSQQRANLSHLEHYMRESVVVLEK